MVYRVYCGVQAVKVQKDYSFCSIGNVCWFLIAKDIISTLLYGNKIYSI